MRLWLISFWSLNRLKWRMSLSYTSNIKNTLSFHEPEAWKRYPCQAEPLRLGHDSTHLSSRPGNSTWYTDIFRVLIVPNVSCTWSGTVIILLQFSCFVKRKGFGMLFLSRGRGGGEGKLSKLRICSEWESCIQCNPIVLRQERVIKGILRNAKWLRSLVIRVRKLNEFGSI